MMKILEKFTAIDSQKTATPIFYFALGAMFAFGEMIECMENSTKKEIEGIIKKFNSEGALGASKFAGKILLKLSKK